MQQQFYINSMQKYFHGILRDNISSHQDYKEKLRIASIFIDAGEIERLRSAYPLGEITNYAEIIDIMAAFIIGGKIEEMLKIYDLAFIKEHMSNPSSSEAVLRVITLCILKDDIKGMKFLIEHSGFPVAKYPRLLTMACIGSKFPIISFLLEKGIDPNKKDDFGFFPLVAASSFNNFLAVNLLDKQHKALQNCQDKSSMIHIAIKAALMVEISDEKIATSKTSSYKYFKEVYPDWAKNDKDSSDIIDNANLLRGNALKQCREKFKKSVEGLRNIYLKSFPVIKKFNDIKQKPEESNDNGYIIAMRSKELCERDIEPLLKRKAYLEKTKKSDKDRVLELLHLYLVTQYQDVKGFTKYAEGLYAASGKNVEICYTIVKFYMQISRGVEAPQELLKASQALLKTISFSDALLTVYSDVYDCFKPLAKVEDVANYLLELTKLIKQRKLSNQGKACLGFVYKELGDIYDEKKDSQKAVKFYREAFALDNKDEHVFLVYTDNLMRLEDYLTLDKVCNEATLIGNIRTIMMTQLAIVKGQISLEEGECKLAEVQMSDVERDVHLEFTYRRYMLSLNHKKAIGYINELIGLRDKIKTEAVPKKIACEYNSDQYLRALLLCYIYTSEPEKVLKFELKGKFSSESIWDEHYLVVCIRINAYLQLDQIGEAVELFKLVAAKKLIDLDKLIDSVAALSTLSQGQKYTPQVIKFLSQIKPFIESSKTQEVVKQCEQILTILMPADKREPGSRPTDVPTIFLKDEVIEVKEKEDNGAENFEWEDYDQKKIHKIIQDKKSSILATANESCGQKVWLVNGVEYSGAKIYSVNALFFPKHSAAIAPGFELTHFLNAISNGYCSRAVGKNGIKELSNGMFELKAHCNDRLLARVIYKNGTKERLILFKEIKNHEEIKKICRTQTVEIKKLESHQK